MSKKRASIFAAPDSEVLDIGSFAPKSAIDAQAPPAEQVRAVAEAAHFRSREGAPPKMDAQFKRANRRYRTGRNVQFNVKALKETVDTFYAVTEAQGWVLGYTLQRAIEALQRELMSSK
jgi:hypothetical protein